MPDDVVVPEEEVLEDAAAEEADMESGFTGTPTEKTPPADGETAEAKEAREAEEAAAAAAAATPKYRQITEEEWQALQAKSTEIEQIKADNRKELDRAFGKVGGLERTLKAMQDATPTGYTVDVTDDVVADLKKEYPELGDLTLKALKGFASKLKGTAPVAAQLDPKQVESAVTERLVALQIEALEEEHPKWREVTGASDSNTPYRQWLAKQPAEYQQKLGATNSAAVISKSITKFQADAAAAEKAATDAAAAAAKIEANKGVSSRQQRLAAAVTPKGDGGHAPVDTDDDFEAGFHAG